MSNPFSRDATDVIKKALFKNANEGKWEEVIEIYENQPESHTAKITSSCDTALHIAISNGDEPVVKRLVAVASKSKGALELQNELGNTPLHLAAYLGNAKMCSCIAAGNSKLMGIRNGDNETPFFLAVRHGRKEAFHALHAVCKNNEGDDYCRGKDGETILHSAISGEYFDLAFDIIHHYPKLLNAITQHGFSALHILANKPSAFRSGSLIRGLDKLIYLCIFVDELQLNKIHDEATDLEYKEGASYPGNYHTCVVTFNLLRNVTQILLGRGSREKRDEEKQHVVSRVLCGSRKANAERLQFVEADKLAKGSNSRNINAQGHELFPKNCTTFFNIAKLISKAMLVILGLGSKSVEKMRGKKEKHIWSVQVMEKLLEHASLYQYEDNGKSPIPAGKPTPALSYTLSNIGADGGADELMRPTTIDEIVDATEDHAAEKEKKSTPNKAQAGEKENCWRETLCAVLQSLGVVQNNPSLKTVCPEGKGGAALDMERKETPILIAAKNGVEEMVWGILKQFPVAIHDMDHDKKNIVLLAVEHRQPHVYNLLHQRKIMNETIFRKTDMEGNSALHLAAKLGQYRPWLIPGAALQMQWEIKWYEFVKNSMPLHFFPRYNNASKTPRDIFSETHNELVKEGGAWLTNTSQSCSVVAALIATVAFATSATVPGGVKSDDSGTPTLQNEPAFNIFAISSLVALCFSVTSVVMFLAILTSRFQEKDFGKDLPRKLLVGLTSLFISIGSMLLSFCAGHFFVLKQKLQYAAFPMYAITCLPVTFFAVAQFPLYFDLIWATIRKIPQRSSK